MPQQVTQHRHCWICGKAIPPSERVCSDECQSDLEGQQRKRKLMQYVLYGAVALTIILIFFGFTQGG